jgi:protein TonB
MKVSNLKWKQSGVIILLVVGIFFNSCDSVDYSGKNSTASNDTMISTDHTAVVNDTVSTGMLTDTLSSSSTSTGNIAPSTSTSSRKGRTGKISYAPVKVDKAQKMTVSSTGYYNYAEVAPVYSGGQTAISNYITNNLQYPEEALENNVEGTVKVQIGVDENGNIASVNTVGDKLGYGLDEEAVKVVANMPKWTPGTVRGKKVKTTMILPITYKIEE